MTQTAPDPSRPVDQPVHETTEKNERPLPPLPNYTLSTVCPGCGADMFRLACKVRCKRCGFMWDCSEV